MHLLPWTTLGHPVWTVTSLTQEGQAVYLGCLQHTRNVKSFVAIFLEFNHNNFIVLSIHLRFTASRGMWLHQIYFFSLNEMSFRMIQFPYRLWNQKTQEITDKIEPTTPVPLPRLSVRGIQFTGALDGWMNTTSVFVSACLSNFAFVKLICFELFQRTSFHKFCWSFRIFN